MIVLGITGGVGSGKSRVLYDLETKHNAYIIEADKLAHTLMEPGKTIYTEIVKKFGKEVLSDATTDAIIDDKKIPIDRNKLGKIVFGDPEKLKLLDSISHPLVKEEILRIISEEREKGEHNLLVIEAALLIQDGYKNICDEIWYVYVSREERVKRLMKQRGYTREKCVSIFESQASDDYYKDNSDFIIDNEKEYEIAYDKINVRLKNMFENGIM